MLYTPSCFDPMGSLWHRWDPHIHVPGTALNNQYKGADAMEEFVHRIEMSEPRIRALGVTEYFGLEGYERLLEAKKAGRLPDVGLIFPNVELRFSIETKRSSPINFHLLFSPEDPDHVSQIKRFLEGLEFSYKGETYRCRREDLIRLGKAHDSSIVDDEVARSVGSNQFKVDFPRLKEKMKMTPWVQTNMLVAVAGGENDGTSGLRDSNGSFDALRKEIECFANVVFSSNPKQTQFWLGEGSVKPEVLEKEYGGLKPCLHGSDAHSLDKVGVPDGGRNCWIKGDLAFESLRQACIEPKERVFVGTIPPRGSLPNQTITDLTITNAPWLKNGSLKINPSLVAVIGARGSGKTALADLIAAGGLALFPHFNDKSFIMRAREHVGSSESILNWETGETTRNNLGMTDIEELLDFPHVQYLSQQFVDQLCSAETMDDALVKEIERVIFDAHPLEDRMGASSFAELLDARLDASREKREQFRETLSKASAAITEENTRKAGLKAMEKEYDDRKKAIEKDRADLKSLVAKGSEERAKRLDAVSQAADAKRVLVEAAKCKVVAIGRLAEDVRDFRERRFGDILRELRTKRAEAGLSDDDWQAFGLGFVGDVDSVLDSKLKKAHKALAALAGAEDPENPLDPGSKVEIPFISENSDLSAQTLFLLDKEVERLQKLVGTDAANSKRYSAISAKVTKDEAAQAKLLKQIEHARGADARIKEQSEARRKAYAGVFESIIEEERELADLYRPIKERIDVGEGSLRKLSFSVKRKVALKSWAEQGERLLDLRKSGAFKGRGELLAAAQAKLGKVLATGGSSDASEALSAFVQENRDEFLRHMPDGEDMRTWGHGIAEWLYGTNHITVEYGLQYDGVDIEQLSPGTRGIVLLLLYLALDAEDSRPLIIDQPEENLDPKSIFAELVPRFREAKKRRQIIIITHNANLVVNTDAEQVVIAQCGPHRAGQLPEISYQSGSLENPMIQKSVCEILEGGERAFRERARRLRLGI